MKSNLLVVAHPDDEILGFGATGCKLVKEGEIVQPFILCGNVEARNSRPEVEQLRKNILSANKLVGFNKPKLANFPNLKLNNVDHIDLVKSIEEVILSLRPSRIFTHHPNDLNDDHRQISRACLVASKVFQRRNMFDVSINVYFMEIQSSTEWSSPFTESPFMPNVFVDVSDFIDLKIQALNEYSKVMREDPHPRSRKMIKALAGFRGSQCGRNYAEAFQLIFSQNLI